jgi:hypothetical protein
VQQRILTREAVMAKSRYLLAVLVLATFWISSAEAYQRYVVHLTRRSSNLYRVDGQSVWIRTRYCYEYAYDEEAAIGSNEITFLDSGTQCPIRDALSRVDVTRGSYNVRLTYEETDLYSTQEGVLLRMSGCLGLGFNEEAVLRVSSGGYGSVTFLNGGRRCTVDEILQRTRF